VAPIPRTSRGAIAGNRGSTLETRGCARRVNVVLFPDGAVQAAGLFEGVQQRVCSFQVGRLEPFREPVIDWLKQRLRVGGSAPIP
jgi:hypothetical protein